MTRFYPLASATAFAILLSACSDSDPGAGLSEAAPPLSAQLTITPLAAPEGSPGEISTLSSIVSVAEPQARDIAIRFETRDGTAVADEDYLAASGEVILPAGELQTRVDIEILGDADDEGLEYLELSLSADEGVSFNANSVNAYIANDDSSCDAPYQKANPNRWRRLGEDPLNYAHRGGVIDFPENTLYAYAEVARAGADVLEMDVYQTADNELVILHDLSVDRTTNGTGQVVDLTLTELRELDAAYWFVEGQGTPHDQPESAYTFRGIATGDKPPPEGYRAEDFRIPTLEEALQRFPDKLINLELKPDLDGEGEYEAQMAELLQRYGRRDDMIAVSFVDEAANNFKAAAPCVHTAVPLDQGTLLVLSSFGDNPMPPVPEHVAFQVPPDTSQIQQVELELTVVTDDFITDSHNVNLAVQVWTINTCEEMLRMIDLGVDGIMTDRPILLEEILNTPPEERNCP